MVRSKATSAHVLQAIEVDFSGVEAARGALKKAWKEPRRDRSPIFPSSPVLWRWRCLNFRI